MLSESIYSFFLRAEGCSTLLGSGGLTDIAVESFSVRLTDLRLGVCIGGMQQFIRFSDDHNGTQASS